MIYTVILTDNGYIVGVCRAKYPLPNSVTEQSVEDVMTMLRNAPSAPDGYTYKLRADTLDWELVELPHIEEDEDATESDYIEALQDLGVEVDA